MFSSKSFQALLFTFRTLVNLDFIFVYDAKQVLRFFSYT